MGQALSRFFFVLFTALFLTACGSGNDSVQNTSGSAGSGGGSGSTGGSSGSSTSRIGSVGLEVLGSELVADGSQSVLVRATVTDTDGAPMSGKVVDFTTTLGNLSGNSATTGDDGVVEVTLTSASTTGTATLRASSGGVLADPIDVAMVAGAPSLVDVSAAPSTLRPGESAVVTVTVTDGNSNPVEGSEVTLAVAGSSGGSLANVKATTDANGQVKVGYTAGSNTGTETITVRTENARTGTGTLTVSSSAVTLSGITLVRGADSITANNSDSVTLQAKVTDSTGAPAASVPVTFTTTLGTIGGTATTNSDGIAETTLTAGIVTGVATVTATAGGFIAQTDVAFVADAPENVELNIAPDTLAPEGKATVTATVTDVHGNAVADETLTFSVVTNTSGGSLSTLTGTTDVNGQVKLTYTAGSNQGTDTLSATAENGKSVTSDVTVSSASAVVGGLSLLSGAPSITADGASEVVIRATVTDDTGKPLPSVTVDFSTTLGTVTVASAATDSQGIAVTNLRSATTAGVATVTATAAGFVRSVDVGFVAGKPATITLTAEPSTVTTFEDSTLIFRLTDANGNPISNEEVAFRFVNNNSGASLLPATAFTNVNGEASVQYTAGSKLGVDEIEATLLSDSTKTATATVTVDNSSDPVGAVALNLGATQMIAGALDQIVIRATVTNLYGEPVAGKTVTFSTTAGSFVGGVNSDTSDENGIAEVLFVAPDKIGAATITAASENVFSTGGTINFVAGELDSVVLEASPSTVSQGGTVTVTLTASDANGNPRSGDTFVISVPTNASGGSVDSRSVETDVNGRASFSYIAGFANGTDTLQAKGSNSAGAVTGTVNVVVDSAQAVIGSLTFEDVNGLGSIVADGTSKVTLRATVKDSADNPLPGATVSFETTSGTLSAPSGTTDNNGVVDVDLTSDSSLGQAVVTAKLGGFSQSVVIGFVAGGADSSNSTIAASPNSIPADGTTTTTVTVVLADENGHILPDGQTVTLLTDAGTITSPNPAVTASGRAEFTLQAPTTAGAATLQVREVTGLQGSAIFGAIADGSATTIVTSVANPSLSVSGVGRDDNTPISIQILGADGNPIDETNWGPRDNTLKVSFVSRPNGGEYLTGQGYDNSGSGDLVTIDSRNASTTTQSGMGLAANEMLIRTRNGSAQINLQAGNRPGIVELRLEALDAGHSSYSSPVVALVPQISIASGPAHTIVITGPITGAINNLGDGNYERVLSAVVTDQFGNAVADGTPVNLGLIDRIIATHDDANVSNDGATTASSATFTDLTPEQTDGSSVNFNTATIRLEPNVTFGTQRGIQSGDRLLILNAAPEDKSRFVASAGNTTLDAQTNFSNTATNLAYVVGASLNGANIGSLDDADAFVPGTTTTTGGIAPIRLRYPANVNTILLGLLASDTRYSPADSADVYIVASSNDGAATTITNQYGYAAIAGFTLTPTPAALGGSGTVSLELRDGGDTIPLPLYPVSASVRITNLGSYDECTDPSFLDQTSCEGAGETWQTLTSDFAVSASSGNTNTSGIFTSTITVTGSNIQSGDSAEIIYSAGDATATVTVTIP